MKYDFTTVSVRRSAHATKWNVGEDELPMWIADMDFATPPEIYDAVMDRAKKSLYGYTRLPDEWFESYQHWWKNRHGLELQRENILFCTGIVPAIASIIRRVTSPGEKIVIQSPVYNMFFNCIEDNGRRLSDNALIYKHGEYSIDWEDLEQRLADPLATVMMICNPHNPVGKIWDRETLARIGDMCAKHGVLVISDEIHCDITYPGCDYVPFASINETCRMNSISCYAPTKTFNLAGLKTAATYTDNHELLRRIRAGFEIDGVMEVGAFSVDASIAAFEKGGQWLEELRQVLEENRTYCTEFIEKNLPMLKLVRADATYLLWLDCTAVADWRNIAAYLREKTGLFVLDGARYGVTGEGFLRINIACPMSLVVDGMNRLKDGIESYIKGE